jgi:hypothetical protein
MVQTRYSVALSVRLLEGEAVWDDKKACYYGFHRCILETSRVLWALSYQREVKGEGAYGVWRELFVVLTVGGNRASFCPSGRISRITVANVNFWTPWRAQQHKKNQHNLQPRRRLLLLLQWNNQPPTQMPPK